MVFLGKLFCHQLTEETGYKMVACVLMPTSFLCICIVFRKIGTPLFSFHNFQMLVSFNKNYATVFVRIFSYRYNVFTY